jgi:hypothetical protein
MEYGTLLFFAWSPIWCARVGEAVCAYPTKVALRLQPLPDDKGQPGIADRSRAAARVLCHGIGAPTPGRTSWWQRAKGIQQGYGGGITKKIVDCHVAILGVWHPGDRIYHGWFTEGFDTRDLKEAKALLEELAAWSHAVSGKENEARPVDLCARGKLSLLIDQSPRHLASKANFKKGE